MCQLTLSCGAENGKPQSFAGRALHAPSPRHQANETAEPTRFATSAAGSMWECCTLTLGDSRTSTTTHNPRIGYMDVDIESIAVSAASHLGQWTSRTSPELCTGVYGVRYSQTVYRASGLGVSDFGLMFRCFWLRFVSFRGDILTVGQLQELYSRAHQQFISDDSSTGIDCVAASSRL